MAEKPISFSNLKTFLEQVKSKLKTVAFTGSYTDLLNKPNIPTVDSSLSSSSSNPVQNKVINAALNTKAARGTVTSSTIDKTFTPGLYKNDNASTPFGDLRFVIVAEDNDGGVCQIGFVDGLIHGKNDFLFVHRGYGSNGWNGWDLLYDALINRKYYKAATKVVGTTKSGHTTADCDYLCDGTADQTEIQAAINALPASGGKVVLLEGTYNISSSIKINKPNVTIEGMGKQATQLLYTGSGFGGCIQVTGDQFTIKDLYMEYCNDNISDLGIYINGSSATTGLIDNVYMYFFAYGINTTQKTSSDKVDACHTIRNCIASNCQVGFQLNSNRNTIQGCYAINCSETGINVEGSYNKISDNYVFRGGSYTSSQSSIKINSSAANNFISNNMIPGKNYTNNGGTTNTFTNNKYS